MRHLIKIPLAGISLILFLVTLLLYLYFFTSVPEQQLNDWLEYYLPENTGYKVTVDKVYRDLWRQIKFEGIKVFKISGDKSVPIGFVNTIEAQYSIRDILFQDYHFSNFSVKDIDISLVPDDRLIEVAADTSVRKPPSQLKLPDVIIDNIEFRNINIQAPLGGEIVDFIIPVFSGSFGSDGGLVDLQIDSINGSCPQKEFEVEYLNARCFIADDGLMIEALNIKTSRSLIGISGRFGELKSPDYKLAIDISPIDLADVAALTGVKLEGVFEVAGSVNGDLKKFGGELKGSGSLFERSLDNFTMDFRFDDKILYVDSYVGNLFESPLVGSGLLDFNHKPERYTFDGNFQGLNLQKISPDIYSSFSGDFQLNGQGFSSESFYMEVDAQLDWADIDIYHFDRVNGKVDFDLEAINFHPGFAAYYKHTTANFSGRLEYQGDIDLLGKARFDDLADFTGQIFIQDLDGVGNADFEVTGPTLDFTIDGGFYSDSCRFYGLMADSFAFDLNLKSFISHKVGRVEGRWFGGDLYTIPVDSGFFSTSISGEKYFLDSIRVENANNKLDFAGSFDNTLLPPSLVIDTLNMVLWKDTVYTITPLVIDVYEKEVEFQDFKLYSELGSLDMIGVITYDEQMDLYVTTENLRIQTIAAYFIDDRSVSASLSGDIYVNGDFTNPVFVSDIWVSDLAVDNYELGQLNVRANYSYGRIEFVPAELENPHGLYTLTGTLPINLSFTSEEELFPPEEMDLEFRASGDAATLVPIVIPSIREFETVFEIDIGVKGTFDKPIVSGTYLLNEGTLYTMELVEPLRDVVLGGRLENDKIYIDTLTAYATLTKDSFSKTIDRYLSAANLTEESKGLITGFGTVTLLDLNNQLYDLTISGYNCEFYADAYDVQLLTDLFITVKGKSPPLVEGWAEVKRFELRDRFSKFATESAPDVAVEEDSTLWDIKLDIAAPNNIWIKNADAFIETEGAADMELSGELTVTREKGILGVLGELDVESERSYFYLANMKFKIEEGSMTFDNPDTLDPQVNLNVTTRVLTPSQQTSYTDLDLVISGRLSNLKIGTSAGSNYSDEDILFVLLENIIATGEGNNVSDNLAFMGGRLVSSSLSDLDIVDMVDINIDQYDDDAGESKRATRFTVWKYISPKLLVNFSTRMSQEKPGQTVGFEYIHSDNISFEGRQGTADEGVSFDLKLRYEY